MEKTRGGIIELTVRLFVAVLNVLYLPLKLIPSGNKVTFISRIDDKIPMDFALIIDAMRKADDSSRIVVLPKKLGYGLVEKIKYAPHIFRQMYHIATSKVVVLDSYSIPICILRHKKQLKVIQLWHGLGSFKKFGHSILDKGESMSGHVSISSKRLAEIMRMHANYDVIISSNPKSAEHFAEAFNYSKESVKIISLPRVDFLSNNKLVGKTKEDILAKNPTLLKKSNILYAPTFRRNQSIGKKIQELANAIDYDKYNLIIKTHPLTDADVVDSRVLRISEFTSMQLLTVADYVVTDYSAISYEAFLLNKPVFLYAYDEEKYNENRGFYTPLSLIPAKKYSNAKAVAAGIASNDYDAKSIKRFIDRQVIYKTDNASKLAGIIKDFTRTRA